MTRGGARNRSGPQKDPNSGRSEALGYALTALPAEGYGGPVPRWPLPKRAIWIQYKVDGDTVRERDDAAETQVADRERELWEWAWRTPQACAWSMPSESWRLMTIAMWVRTYILCESDQATAADKGSLHRFADQIGLTPAGLKENGWQVAPDQLAERAADTDDKAPAESAPTSSRARMKALAGGRSA